jgi:hypothetical protein
VPGDTHRVLEVRTSFFGQSFKHVLLPVYVMGYRFKDKQYNVLVNGSTGEVQGGAPVSVIKLIIIGVVLAALIGGGIALYMIFGAHHNATPANTTQTRQTSTTVPEPYELPVHFKRNGSDEVWQLEFSFAGADAAAKAKNWQDFRANSLQGQVESEAERVIRYDTRSSYDTLSRKVQAALDAKFKNADGTPRFSNVRVSEPRATSRRQH